MAFFLVTYTSVVEADDEHDAASKVVSGVRDGGPVRVTVKSDELTVRTVTIAAETRKEQPPEAKDDSNRADAQEDPPAKPDHAGDRSTSFRSVATVAVLAALSVTLGYIRFHG